VKPASGRKRNRRSISRNEKIIKQLKKNPAAEQKLEEINETLREENEKNRREESEEKKANLRRITG